jgi:hypothetical protein
MLISSEANGAQSRAPGEPTRFFDDIGCLAADAKSRGDGTIGYVQLASGGWASTADAWFAVSTVTRTPMDYGIVAFASAEEAAAADRDARARRWRDVITYAEAR